MGTKDATKVYRVLGNLYVNPTNLTTTPGTHLGVYDQLVLMPMHRHHVIEDVDSKRAGQAIEVIKRAPSYKVGVSLRQWDNDVVGQVFQDHSSGSNGPLISGNTDAGTRQGGTKLFFRAEAVDDHPSVLLYNAVFVLEEEAELELSALDELLLEVVIYALPDDNGNVREVGVRDDLTLSP